MKFLFLILWGASSFAGINEFNNKFLTARLFVDVPSYTFELKSKVNTAGDLMWKPNIRSLTGVDVSIHGLIGAGISWASNDDPGSAQKKGVTDTIDYRVALDLTYFHIEGNYQTYSGFYLENTGTIDPTFATTGVYIQDRDMRATNITVNANYVFGGERFSYAAATGQNKRQEQSGGSWVVGIAGGKTAFSSTQYMIPLLVRNKFGEDQNLKNAEFYSLTIKGGYGYTWVWSQKWFLTLLVDVGGGGEYRKYGDGINTTTSGGSSAKADALFAVGYNGDDFLAAIIGYGDMTEYTLQSITIPSTVGDAKIAIGVHF